MVRIKSLIGSLGLLALPAVALAQGVIDATGGLGGAIVDISAFITDYIIPLLIGIAALLFIYGVLKYVLNQDDEEARKKARSLMIYGIIAIFVMVSVWGLVNLLSGTFDFDTNAPETPSVEIR